MQNNQNELPVQNKEWDALLDAIENGDIKVFNELSKTCDCSAKDPKSKMRPIDLAANFCRLDIIEALLKFPNVTMGHCFNEQKVNSNEKKPDSEETNVQYDQDLRHLLYWICFCENPQSRQRMLQWLLEDDRYKALESLGVTKAHVLAALGLYEPSAPAETLNKPCYLGLTPLHFFYLSGYQFAQEKNTSTYARIEKNEVIPQLANLQTIETGVFKGESFDLIMRRLFSGSNYLSPITNFFDQLVIYWSEVKIKISNEDLARLVMRFPWFLAESQDKKNLKRLATLVKIFGKHIDLNYGIYMGDNSTAVLLMLKNNDDEYNNQVKELIVEILKENLYGLDFEGYDRKTGEKLKNIHNKNLAFFRELVKIGQSFDFSSDVIQFDVYRSKPIPERFKQYQDFPFLFDVLLHYKDEAYNTIKVYCDSVNKEKCPNTHHIDLNVRIGKKIEGLDKDSARNVYASYTAAYLIIKQQNWPMLEMILKKFPQAIDLTVKPEGETKTLLALIEKTPVYNKVIALQSEKTKKEIEKMEQEKQKKLDEELIGGDVNEKKKKNSNQQSAQLKTKKQKEQEQRKAQKLKESEESERNQKDRKSEQAQRKKEIEIAQQEAAKRIAEEKKKEKEKQGNKEKEKPYLTDWLGQKKLSNIETWSKEVLNDPSFGPMNIVWLLKKLAKRRTTWDEAKEIGLLKFLNLKKIRDKLQHIDLQKKQDQKAICNIAYALYLLNCESAWLKESGFGDMLAEKIIELTKRLPEVTPRDGRFAASSGRTEQLDTESMQVVTKYQPADKSNIFAARQILQAYYWFGYNIVLMSALPKNDETKAKLGTIYLLPTTGEYLLRNGEEIIHGKINTTTLHLDFANNNVLAKQINHPDCKSSILQQISNTGHIHWTLNLPNACMEKLNTIVESDPKPDSSNGQRNFADRLKKLLLGEDRITFKEEESFKNIAFADIYIKDKITGEKYVIEIDGPHHESKVEVDQARDRMFMERFGVTAIIRITSEEKEMLNAQNDVAVKEFLVNKGIPTALFKNNLNYTETSHGMFAKDSPISTSTQRRKKGVKHKQSSLFVDSPPKTPLQDTINNNNYKASPKG